MNCRLCKLDLLSPQDADVRDYEYGVSGEYTYYRCGQCGLFNISPVPSPNILSLAYPASYHAYNEQPTRLARLIKKRYWKRKAARCLSFVSKSARILDLGCSTGDLLFELKQLGCTDVSGIDNNQHVINIARKRGLNTVCGGINELSQCGQKYDQIIMTNFIEHVYAPVETMMVCQSMLGKNGIIVGETPNVNSWDYKVFRRYWGGYHTPRHLYLFNVTNLRILARLAGLEVVSIKNIIQPAHWALSIQNFIQDTAYKSSLENGRGALFTPLLMMFLPLNIVQMMVSRTSLLEFVFKKITA